MPTVTRCCTGWTWPSRRGAGGTPRSQWGRKPPSCCTSTASTWPRAARSPSTASRSKRNLAEIRRRVGLVFQDPDDQLFMPTVHDDVAFGPANLGLKGEELEQRVKEALEAVQLLEHADRPPHHLSFGQRRRAAVATVLAMRPSILVLDEPSSNLDPAARRELADVLRSLPLTVLMVTHDLPYALELCDRSVILNNGRITADGSTEELLQDTALMAANRLELPFGFDPFTRQRQAAQEPDQAK
ncbi:MAG: energy-coupling factor ABC transporter ATP-binding protein [Ilumatobacteraceae bacterium]